MSATLSADDKKKMDSLDVQPLDDETSNQNVEAEDSVMKKKR